ncbi:hypothetical protein C5N14_28850 [Micromonospora sp. MW-13]|uniref:hypothetical protein n=1 Tax=Micromonospora sp. MW-13 TaxID=2094022 RepID=UPI000EEF534A|nr:hypothetical protein [Micromonospora sp. MW-13]RGC65358.1 hypothetical protein C5N14_28850 [Micromonospora sp. MW-13]
MFSLSAALGAIAGGALAPRVGHARTATTSALAAIVPLAAILAVPAGPLTLLAAGFAGALLYMNQPLLILAAQNAAPDAPAAAAGVVIGVGGTAAGLLYIVSGLAQDAIGLTATIAVTISLLAPTAMIIRRGRRASPPDATRS